MDVLNVLKPFFAFFENYCRIRLTFGGASFTIGSLFLWCILATILITFLRGLANG